LAKAQKTRKGYFGIQPRSPEQKQLADAIISDTPLVVATGPAGTGKTLIALAVGLHLVIVEEKYRHLLYTRNQEQLGKDIGALPGSLSDKTDPFMLALEDNLREMDGAPTLYMLKQQDKVSTPAIQTMRGRSITDTLIIFDEVQNMDVTTVKSLITRAGRNSKVIVLGSLKQIDAKHLRDEQKNGLARLVSALEQSGRTDMYEHIHLVKNERSELAQLIDEIM
jgi:PhoH-like ATPase